MKRMLVNFAVAGTMLAAGAGWGAPLAAQVVVSSPVRFGIMGGATAPVGDFSDVAKTGWNAGVLLDIGLPLVPLGFRVDGTWNQLGDKTLDDGATIKNRFIAGTVDAVYTLNSLAMTKFYLIGGVGVYNFRQKNDNLPIATPGGVVLTSTSHTETKFGVNAGAGFRVQLVGFSTFIEARWHDVFTSGTSAQMIPIDVGITF
jgi:hypothetical protein